MELCSDGHDEICHDERKCPICTLIASMEARHEEEKEDLTNNITDLTSERDDLARQLE